MFRKRGGRKLVVTPDGAPWAPRPWVDTAMVEALARAFRWQRMLDEGVGGTIDELAISESTLREIGAVDDKLIPAEKKPAPVK
jgi:hypothetical protein